MHLAHEVKAGRHDICGHVSSRCTLPCSRPTMSSTPESFRLLTNKEVQKALENGRQKDAGAVVYEDALRKFLYMVLTSCVRDQGEHPEVFTMSSGYALVHLLAGGFETGESMTQRRAKVLKMNVFARRSLREMLEELLHRSDHLHSRNLGRTANAYEYRRAYFDVYTRWQRVARCVPTVYAYLSREHVQPKSSMGDPDMLVYTRELFCAAIIDTVFREHREEEVRVLAPLSEGPDVLYTNYSTCKSPTMFDECQSLQQKVDMAVRCNNIQLLPDVSAGNPQATSRDQTNHWSAMTWLFADARLAYTDEQRGGAPARNSYQSRLATRYTIFKMLELVASDPPRAELESDGQGFGVLTRLAAQGKKDVLRLILEKHLNPEHNDTQVVRYPQALHALQQAVLCQRSSGTLGQWPSFFNHIGLKPFEWLTRSDYERVRVTGVRVAEDVSDNGVAYLRLFAATESEQVGV